MANLKTISGVLAAMNVEKVWQKAARATGRDNLWGIDDYGNLIHRHDYGNTKSPYGWQIDHFPVPTALGGSDHIDNLRPLHHQANASHGGILGGLLNAPSAPDQSRGLASLFGFKPPK